eukprot:TRINITY_DN80090_c0_g1_i1.p1 TRINITY_DN80090_c0_g1~~TRINITY_DN80090_c0_g1_i1.p1  ORF type:complete len:255 (+),score=100.88 TRINITY_DN80090_c0_g1_i1:112-876(+)
MVDWKKTLLAAGVTAGACAVVYYLLKEEEQAAAATAARSSSAPSDDKKKQKQKELTTHDFIQLMKEVIAATGKMKYCTKEIIDRYKAVTTPINFQTIYEAVSKVNVQDPVEKSGLTPAEFEAYLVKYEREPAVKPVLEEFFDRPDPSKGVSAKVKDMSVKKILDIHKLMLQETEEVLKQVKALPDKSKFNVQTAVICAQVLTALKVEKTFDLSTQDIDAAVMQYHAVLANDEEFAVVNNQIQHNLGILTSSLTG